jgi:hypothetical protein
MIFGQPFYRRSRLAPAQIADGDECEDPNCLRRLDRPSGITAPLSELRLSSIL